MSAESSQGTGTRRALRVLAVAYASVFALLVATGIAVALFGKPQTSDVVVRLHVAPPVVKPVVAPVAVPVPEVPAETVPPPMQPGPTATAAPVYAGTELVADPALIQMTGRGPLPRIAANGRTPMQAYAVPVADSSKPRIAIVITGLGISAKATAAALAGLPPQVTLAFVPYASDIQSWVTQARRQGHEVLLEVPMEPFDFSDSDPGPHTLRVGIGEDANTDRLVWALTRFTGYRIPTRCNPFWPISERTVSCSLRMTSRHVLRSRTSPLAPARRSPSPSRRSIRFRPPWKSTINCMRLRSKRAREAPSPAPAFSIRSPSIA
jgi:hypothetical protein